MSTLMDDEDREAIKIVRQIQRHGEHLRLCEYAKRFAEMEADPWWKSNEIAKPRSNEGWEDLALLASLSPDEIDRRIDDKPRLFELIKAKWPTTKDERTPDTKPDGPDTSDPRLIWSDGKPFSLTADHANLFRYLFREGRVSYQD